MMHFFRRSKIHIDCFTNRREVIEFAPIVNGIEVIPEWWKALPKSAISPSDGFSPTPTMKTCVGMYDYYNKSLAMPLWSDLSVCVYENHEISWQFSDFVSRAGSHSYEQYDGVLPKSNFRHFKIDSPWLISTKSDINWLVSDPIYNHENFTDYVLAQGIVNFSKQNASSLQFFLNTKEPKVFTIPFRSMFLFTPMTTKKVVIHRHLVSNETFISKQVLTNPISFINKYKTYQKIPKCPYKDNIK